MRQDTNELIVGIDLGETRAQATYMHPSVKEPMTLDDVLTDTATSTAELFQSLLKPLALLLPTSTLTVMVTVDELTQERAQEITEALAGCGCGRGRIFVQDYRASFYYHTVNQKKELWAHDVALLTCKDETVCGSILHIDKSTRPAIAKVEEICRQPMDEAVRGDRSDEAWNQERDRLFFELLKKLFERRRVLASYLVGDYFDKSWARRSVQFLCMNRKAFLGSNLYSKGACYAAMERIGVLARRDILFGGRDMVEWNLEMEMTIRGKTSTYPLINAGGNWYDLHAECEFVLHGDREIRLTSRDMTGGETVLHTIRLTDLPRRPDRATRLRLIVSFSSATCCNLEVEDLGFGGLYKSSGRIWKRKILF